MKLYDIIPGHNYCVISAAAGTFSADITRDDDDYLKIDCVRVITLADLKHLQDDLDICAYDVIQADGADGIEQISEYNAVTESGEEIKIFVPDLW